MKTTIGKSTHARLFLVLTGLSLMLTSCRCDLEEDKEDSAAKTEKNIVKKDSLPVKGN